MSINIKKQRFKWLATLCWLMGAILSFSASVNSDNKSDEIIVAVASNFISPAKAIVAEFEHLSHHRVKLVFGSSGKILAQIKNGAPFDVFLSADQEKPHVLVASGNAIASSQFTYAVGQLVLWSSDPNYISDNDAVLKSGKFKFIAIANPKLAPYGKAAMDVINSFGDECSKKITSKIVQGENIGQAFQFVSTGNAELGFVALSQVMKNTKIEKGSAWVIPQYLYSPIKQDAVMLKTAENKIAAHQFVKYLHSDAAKKIIQGFGYVVDY